MRNRAKCKLCDDIIESMYTHDFQRCKCGEIAVDGGKDYHRVLAKDWDNFLRVDDEGNIVVPSIIDKHEDASDKAKDNKPKNAPKKRNRKELISMLDEMIKGFQRLPQHALEEPINHSDWVSLMTFLSEFFKAED